MLLDQLEQIISFNQNRTLSGGITGRNLRIIDNGSGQLTLSGDILITLKVLDLTTSGAPRIQSLMKLSEQAIASKLRGGADGRANFYEYNSAKNSFTNKNYTYSLRYNFNYTAKVEQIPSLSYLAGNDFVLALVDGIRSRFTDKFGRSHAHGGIAGNFDGGPATVIYSEWEKDYLVGVHEFFHVLGLSDLEDAGLENRLMYHIGRKGAVVNDNERATMNNFIMQDLRAMTKKTYSNPGNNMVNQLRTFLNNKSNGFQYNKAKFR